MFVTITNEGALLFSKQSDIMNQANQDLPVVLGRFRYILERAMSMWQFEAMGVDDVDEVLDPNDNLYLGGEDDEEIRRMRLQASSMSR